MNHPSNKQHGEIEHFRSWLHELAARLICTHPDEIGQEITDCLKTVTGFWGFDAAFLTEIPGSSETDRITYLFTGPDIGKAPLDNKSLSEAPWFLDKALGGETLFFHNLPDDLPASAKAERALCKKEGLETLIVLPLNTSEATQGVLVLSSTRKLPRLSQESMEDLLYLEKVLAGSIDREKRITSVRLLMRFEKLLSEISARYINLPTTDIEKSLKKDFERLGQLLGADRLILYLISDDQRNFSVKEPFAWWPHEDDLLIKKVVEENIEKPAFFDNSRYLFEKWLKGETFRFTTIEELPREAHKVKKLLTNFGVKSYLSIPIMVAGSTAGVLIVVTTRSYRAWQDELVSHLRLFGEVFINAMVRKQTEERLTNAFSEIKKLKDQIEADYVYLREEIKEEHTFGDIVGQSEALRKILVKVKQVAPTNANVLILGETGTGKGMMARAIHNASRRAARPFMQVNCAALSPTLIESELFGYEKGAFTGAQVKRIGRFELAHGTTLFLDEIGELPLELQAKLLRVLQDGEVERVGGSTTIKTDVRVVAATNKDLEKEVEAGLFRRDLWYRLNVFPICVPPLRERIDDIPLFVNHFVNKYGKLMGKSFSIIPQKAIKALQNYSWPGNIRELENIIERAVITSPNNNLQIEIPAPRREGESFKKAMTITDLEREHITNMLDDTLWRINGPNGAAQRLGMNPSTLRFRMIKLGIKRPMSKAE